VRGDAGMGIPEINEGVKTSRHSSEHSSKQLKKVMNIVGMFLFTGFALLGITVPLNWNGSEVIVIESVQLHGKGEFYSFVSTVIMTSILYFSLVALYFSENGKRPFMGSISALAIITVILFFGFCSN
jgi:hypothetical protein